MRFHRWKSVAMILCLFLTAVLPITVNRLLGSFESGIYSRADATPAVIGAVGSPLDLALQSLYFSRKLENTVPYSAALEIAENENVRAIPIHIQHTARSYPIVATTNDYFSFRTLRFAQGRPFGILGECVVGATVAKQLQLKLEDGLLSDRTDLLGLAGDYPLKLRVVGILAAGDTADDSAVFVDLKTQWVIQGLGHGHQDLESDDQSDNVKRQNNRIVALPSKVVPYTEITPNNLASFHFHGSLDQFPITAIIVKANDLKSETILEAKYQNQSLGLQFIRPREALETLMSTLFKIRRFVNMNTTLVAFSTALLTGLVMLLSLKLRQDEMDTMFKLGCDRKMIATIQLTELGVLLAIGIGLAVGFAVIFENAATRLLESWIAGQS